MKIKSIDSVIIRPNSTLIDAIRWNKNSDKSDRGNLTIRFKTNKEIYSYENVPERIVESFLNAESMGKFFGQEIKDVYTFHKESKWENI